MSEASSTVRPYDPTDRTAGGGDAFRAGQMPVAVYGLGKLGLPVAAAFAEVSGAVHGVDTDPAVVQAVSGGEPPFDHEPGLAAVLAQTVAGGELQATTDGAAAAEAATIHVVVVPVPLAEDHADLAAIDAVIETIGTGLAPGDLVVIESTVPPGTCAERVAPRLSAASGLAVETFGVASCPERTQSGRALEDIRGAYPRIVGGIDAASTEAARAIYREVTSNEVVSVSDARTAEAVKLFEGVYRDVNIALANELAMAFDETGLDVREAIEAANTLPLCDIHTPGTGVGGHCIPYYPYFLMEGATREMSLVATGRAVNDRMPRHVAERTLEALRAAGHAPEGASVAVLGLSYRPGIPETAATPAAPIIAHLQAAGATVTAIDPVVEADFGVPQVPLDALFDLEPDAVVLVTAHEEFATLDWGALPASVIVDGRDALPPESRATLTIGRGGDAG